MKKINIALTQEEKEGLSEDLQEYAMMKKLLLQIAPHCRRDSRFFYGADEPKKKVKAYDSKLEYDENSINDVACKNISKWMVQQLALNGLNARIVSCDSDRCSVDAYNSINSKYFDFKSCSSYEIGFRVVRTVKK